MRVAFGIDGLAPEWIMTFLVDRTQQVMSTLIYWLVEFRRTKEIGSRSTSFPAVHGRIVWNMQEIWAQSYLIKHAGRQSRRRCATFHRECAADRPMDAVQTVQQTEVQHWQNAADMDGNEQTIIVEGQYQRINIQGYPIRFSSNVSDLGELLDDQLKMLGHSLTVDAKKTLVNASVASCLDFCNSLYHGIGDQGSTG